MHKIADRFDFGVNASLCDLLSIDDALVSPGPRPGECLCIDGIDGAHDDKVQKVTKSCATGCGFGLCDTCANAFLHECYECGYSHCQDCSRLVDCGHGMEIVCIDCKPTQWCPNG